MVELGHVDRTPTGDPRGADAPRNLGIVADDPGALNREPSDRLDARVVTVWRLEAVLSSALLVALGAGATYAAWRFDLHAALAVLPVLVALAYAVADVVFVPRLRWRAWCFEVGATEVDLQHGVVTLIRTRVPMARIQHVDTRRGLLERRYGLATLVLFTAAGARAIPGLALETAEATRDRIAALANVRDDV